MKRNKTFTTFIKVALLAILISSSLGLEQLNGARLEGEYKVLVIMAYGSQFLELGLEQVLLSSHQH